MFLNASNPVCICSPRFELTIRVNVELMSYCASACMKRAPPVRCTRVGAYQSSQGSRLYTATVCSSIESASTQQVGRELPGGLKSSLRRTRVSSLRAIPRETPVLLCQKPVLYCNNVYTQRTRGQQYEQSSCREISTVYQIEFVWCV